jgi:hypothetical protein
MLVKKTPQKLSDTGKQENISLVFLNGVGCLPILVFFLKKSCYIDYGLYSLQLGTSADYELMLRMFELHKLNHLYIPEIITCMRVGGVSNSTLKNRWLANRNDKKSWEINNLKAYWFTFLLKPLRKLIQFI